MAVMESTGPFVGDSEAEAWLTARRWPDGVRCPRCERAHPAQRHRRSLRRYRCRHCRCEFTVTSGTALHATKLGLARWAKAAYASDSGPPALAALLGVSAPTARRVSCLLDRGESRGASRFAALLNPCPAEADRWQAPVLPPTMSRSDDPIAGMAAGEKAVMNALRHRQMGATVAAVAGLAGLSVRHTGRCLRTLQGRGLADVARTRIMWGYRTRAVRLWSLTWRDECARALAYLPRRPVERVDDTSHGVPPAYWHLFWSGTSASRLTPAAEGLLIAETLVAGANPHARAWALSRLPAETLRECRTLRGCDRGAAAAGLDFALREQLLNPEWASTSGPESPRSTR